MYIVVSSVCNMVYSWSCLALPRRGSSHVCTFPLIHGVCRTHSRNWHTVDYVYTVTHNMYSTGSAVSQPQKEDQQTHFIKLLMAIDVCGINFAEIPSGWHTVLALRSELVPQFTSTDNQSTVYGNVFPNIHYYITIIL